MLANNKPVNPIFYTDDHYLSHQVRLVLLEKQIDFTEIHVDDDDSLEDVVDLNPYRSLPVLLHRELILYQNGVIFEYLEDRYHHHKLLPENPIDKANYRQLLWRINQDWLSLAHILLLHPDSYNEQQSNHARKQLTESLITMSPLFAHKPYFLSDHFGLCDCVLASMLWRLDQMQIVLPPHLCQPLLSYMQRIFAKPSFQKSIVPV